MSKLVPVIHSEIKQSLTGGSYWELKLACQHTVRRYIGKGQVYKVRRSVPKRAKCVLCEILREAKP